MASIAGTWLFSRGGVDAAISKLGDGGSALDAAEDGVRYVELDEDVTSVGVGGLPDERGVLTLDAALMTGSGELGAVCGLEGFGSAIPVARLVLQKSPHTILVADGAAQLAKRNGLEAVDNSQLVTAHAARRYAEWFEAGKKERAENERKHTDTVGILVRDANGKMAVGGATSGAEFKGHGRVGDSPVVGAGLYAADNGGCAAATGDGDRMLKHCVAVRVVDLMAAGSTPSDACFTVMMRVAESDAGCQAAVVAMDAAGNVGAATTHRGFFVVRWKEGEKEATVIEGKAVVDDPWIHSCV